MYRYLILLKENRTVRLLSIIQLICYFGAWFSHIGVFTLLRNLNAPIWMISLTAAMAFIPSVVIAPFAGVIIDKFRAKPLFIIFVIIEIVTILLLLLIDDLKFFWFLQILVFLRMGTAGIYFQVEMSLLPKILSKDRLKLANEIHSIIWAVSYTFGMACAGLFIAKFGVYTSFIFDAFIYAVTLLMLTKLKLNEEKNDSTLKAWQMIKDGFIYIKSNPILAHLLFLHALVAITSYDTLINILAGVNYKGILSFSLTMGVLNTIRAFGLVVGPIIFSKFANDRTLFLLFIFQGLGLICWAILQFNFYISFIGIFLTGLATSTLWSYTYTLVQTHCDKRFYGRVIAYLDMLFLGVGAFISIITGILYEFGLSTNLITALFGLSFIMTAFYYLRIYKRF